MKKLMYMCIAGALAAGAACSRIETSTSNQIPATNAYEASIRDNNMAAGSTRGTDEAIREANASTNTHAAASGGFMFQNQLMTEGEFLNEAASSSMMQIQLAKLVQQRSAKPEVRQFAEMMMDHHTKAALEVHSIASGMNMTPPAVLMPAHQKAVDKLSKLSGKELDEEYMEFMEDLHEYDIAKFEVASNKAPTVSVKAFAVRTLPILRVHLDSADKLESKID
ncbi:DUF4142 domain-containing protein [Rufibacter ruber]|uniref:DUF4142 domain-containing protein n=1 Tax=Rufibacter ruber TaxID=1783499 RepID=UPI000A73EADF|nr:DUF4142 domain-containing protein [Rufibacter ruber]